MGLLDAFRRAWQPEAQALSPPAPAPEPAAALGRPRRSMLRMFSAAKLDRLTASWTATPQPTDALIRKNQRVLVARSREQAANNDYMKGFLRMCGANIVGPNGIILQAQSRDPNGALDLIANDAIETAWWEWGKPANASITGQESWRAIQRMAVITAAQDGEFFARIVRGADAGPWRFAIQLIDPVRCPVDHDVERLDNGNFVRAGVEMNLYGRPVAYHFTTTDEREEQYRYGGRAFVRVPAGEILHGFVPWLSGQKRGLPWACTGLDRLHHVNGWEQAAVINARVSAAKMGFFEWDNEHGPAPEGSPEPITIDAEPGKFHELPPGVKFSSFLPQYPIGEFPPFLKAMLRGFASGTGVSYHGLSQDLEGVNFSSIRAGTLEEREHWKELQQWLIESLVQPVFEAWLEVALLAGRVKTAGGGTLKAERIEKYRNVEWQPRRWSWVDPRADVAAAVDSKNNLLVPPSTLIREQGRDPSTVYREIAADIGAMRAAGIPEEMILASMGQTIVQPQAPNEPEDAP